MPETCAVSAGGEEMLKTAFVSARMLVSSLVWAASPVVMLFDKGKAVPFYGSASSPEQQQFLENPPQSTGAAR